MKKLYLLLFLAAAQITTSAKEVVYLKNGSIIKGDIVEIIPNKTLTVETADGSTFVCNYDDIDKIAREKSENNEVIAKKSEDNNLSPLVRGYSGQISSATLIGENETIGLDFSAIHGFRFNPKLFIGLGSGIRYCINDWKDMITIPVFANFRYDILNRKISPFIALNSGAAFNIGDSEGTGFYGSFDIGCRFHRFFLSTSIETTKTCEEGYSQRYYWDPDSGNSYYWDTYDDYHQAFSFAFRFGFVF